MWYIEFPHIEATVTVILNCSFQTNLIVYSLHATNMILISKWITLTSKTKLTWTAVLMKQEDVTVMLLVDQQRYVRSLPPWATWGQSRTLMWTYWLCRSSQKPVRKTGFQISPFFIAQMPTCSVAFWLTDISLHDVNETDTVGIQVN